MIDYNRPGSYLAETQEFLKKITNLHEKLGASNPLTDPTVEEIPDEKREVAENLQKTNQDMIDKMHTLIELTQKVIGKMKQHAHAERLGSSGGSPGSLVHESVEELGLVN